MVCAARLYAPSLVFFTSPTPLARYIYICNSGRFVTPSVVAQRECCGVYDNTEGGERLINHQGWPVRWGSGGGLDLILLYALRFWLVSGFLQSRREP